MSEPRKIPAHFRLTGEGPDVTLAAADADGQRQFEMRAYTGAPVEIGIWGKVIFDLDGMRLGRQRKPILLQHDPGQIVGYATEVERDEKGIRMAGRMSAKTDAARQVVDLADEGFPWQASVGLQVAEARYVASDESAVTVNGHAFKGGYLIQKSYLRESSFVPVGADDGSSGAVLEAISKDGLIEAETYKEAQMTDPKTDPVATFAAEHSEAVEGWRDEGRKEARAAEAERAKALAAAFPTRAPFAFEQFIAGADVKAAQAAAFVIVEAESKALNEKLEAALKVVAADAAAGIGFVAAEAEPKNVSLSDLPAEERWKKDAAIRAEFGDKEAWLAYARHEGQTVTIGGER